MRNYERRIEKEKAIKESGQQAWSRYQSEMKRREAIVNKFPKFNSASEAETEAVKEMAKEMKDGVKDDYSGETVKGISSTTIYVFPKELGGGFVVAPNYIAMEAIEWMGLDRYDAKRLQKLEMQAKAKIGSIDRIEEV